MCRPTAVQAEGTTMSQPKLQSRPPSNTRALTAAVAAAREAGALMKTHLRRAKQVNESHQHDMFDIFKKGMKKYNTSQ
jgi:hypothetical protein